MPGTRRRGRISGDRVTQLMLFVLKRVALARLQDVQAGTTIIAGTSALVADDVQVTPIIAANPDRVNVYFAPVSSVRAQRTAENTTVAESIPLEIRIRAYAPGQTDDDVATVEQTLDDLCNAVARALLDGAPLVAQGLGNLNLSRVIQWPTGVQPTPEPGMIAQASVILTADVITV
jgi:hypothetical protein